MNMHEVILLVVVASCWVAALVHHSSALVNEIHRKETEA